MKRVLAKTALFLVTKPRSILTTLLEIAGFSLIVAGFARISVDDGLFAAGAALLLIGWLEA